VEVVVVATSTHEADDAVEAEARRFGVTVVRGSESDVLDRFVQAARAVDGDPLVRITADCPLLDPDVLDETVELLRRTGVDYVSNGGRGPPPRTIGRT
jgi:spore coat polysaccharide biosynthesis protein SpsF (cytidylyltransferase family)